jgi:hypothetical protein
MPAYANQFDRMVVEMGHGMAREYASIIPEKIIKLSGGNIRQKNSFIRKIDKKFHDKKLFHAGRFLTWLMCIIGIIRIINILLF